MNKPNCILIEQDKMIASIVGFRLKKLHLDVQHLCSGNLAKLEIMRADIVVIGLHSDIHNFLGILKEIREYIGNKIPIVVILSNQRQQQLIESNRIPIQGYLASPLEFYDLENMITNLFNENISVNNYLS